MHTTLELASIYAIAALGVVLTAVIVEFFDLTVDGTFTLGAATVAVFLRLTGSPLFAIAAAVIAGMMAGGLTALLWRSGIQPLLSGILVMFALYSINLHVMGSSNVSISTFPSLFDTKPTFTLAFLCVATALLVWVLLLTPLGTIMRASARSTPFLQSMGISPSRPIVAALLISNALVSLAGAAMAQLQRYADISMGDGTLVYSLAAIILGRAVFRNRRRPAWLVIATITGSVIYQLSIYGALRGGLPPVELRILTASLIFVVLALPRLLQLLHAGHRTTSR